MTKESGVEVLGRNFIIPPTGKLAALVVTRNGIAIEAVDDCRSFRLCRQDTKRVIEEDGQMLITDSYPELTSLVPSADNELPSLLLYE